MVRLKQLTCIALYWFYTVEFVILPSHSIFYREKEGESAKEGAIGNDVAEMKIAAADAPNNLKPIIRSVLSLISDLECRLRRPKNRIRAEQ